MIQSDFPVMVDRINELADVFDRRRPNEHALKVWVHTLKEFPIGDVCDALVGWAKVGSKMPAPGDIWKRLNDLRAEKIERDAEQQKTQFEAEASRTFQRSDVFAKKLRGLLRSLQSAPARDSKAWADRIIDCYVNRRAWAGTGEELTMYQTQCAREARGISTEQLDEMRASQDAAKAGFAPAFSDDYEGVPA